MPEFYKGQSEFKFFPGHYCVPGVIINASYPKKKKMTRLKKKTDTVSKSKKKELHPLLSLMTNIND